MYSHTVYLYNGSDVWALAPALGSIRHMSNWQSQAKEASLRGGWCNAVNCSSGFNVDRGATCSKLGHFFVVFS